jgi:fermentation-respiration switch protein FrsA (DUF1100 family)
MRVGKILLYIIAILAILYVLMSPLVLMPVYNTMLFYPFKDGLYDLKAIDGVPCENVYFPSSNGRVLHAWMFNLPGATKTVLISHGNGGNFTYREELISLILHSGASVLVYDYQGYGKSEGSPSLSGICEDGLSGYKYLVEKRNVHPHNIIVFGESIGSGVACYIASRKPCAGIILQSAYTALSAIAREKMTLMRMYPDFLMPATRLDNLSVLRQPHPPVLLVHGAKDQLIPIAHSEQLFNLALEPKFFEQLPDADHNDMYSVDTTKYQQALKDFIASLPE